MRKKVKKGHFTLQERVGSMRTKLEMVEQTEDDWEEDRKCEELKRSGSMISRISSNKIWDLRTELI